MQFFEPIVCFVCFFQCNIQFVDKVRFTLRVETLRDVGSNARPAPKDLFGEDVLVSAVCQMLIHLNNSVREIVRFQCDYICVSWHHCSIISVAGFNCQSERATILMT